MKSKVSIIKCSTYDPASVYKAVKAAVSLIGGMQTFVKKSCKVLLKPNLLGARTPEEAVDTHPEFVRAVARLVKECGGIPAIGDSPGSFFTVKSIDEVFAKSGMKKIADEEGIELRKFDEIMHIDGYPIAKALKDYDFIINLPKMKSHTLMILTGAVKNTYGFVPGLSKVQYHKKAPNFKDFCKVIGDIYSITRPGLSIMDGIIGMDNDGPAAGRVRKLGLVLASADAVSLDAVFGSITGLDYSKNALLKKVTERGLGRGFLKDIEISGESLDSARIKGFILPKTALPHRFPSIISKPLTKLLDFRPIIDEKLCKKCSICKQACPVDAITINKEISRINKSKCVKCFCCHEVCPYDAICIKKSIFTKILWR